MVRRLRTAKDACFSDGLNLMIARQIALPRILIRRGVFSEQEWNEAVDKVLEEIKTQREGASGASYGHTQCT